MSEISAKPKRKWHFGFLFAGLVGLSASMFAIVIETGRNYIFGSRDIADQFNAMISGSTVGMFAVLLLIIPILARAVGRQHWMKVLYLGCMIATAYCGLAYYVDDIRAAARAAMAVNRSFEDARKELAEAEKERDTAQAQADEIKELRPSAGLMASYNDAMQRKKDESSKERGGCKPFVMVNGKQEESKCIKAEKEATAALNAHGLAVAKEKFQARADKARDRIEELTKQTKKGPSEASGMAGLAGDLGGDALRYAALEGLIVPMVKVALQLGAAALFDISLTAIMLGMGYRKDDEAAEATTKGAKVSKPATKPQIKLGKVDVAAAERAEKQAKKTDLQLYIEKYVRPAEVPTTVAGAVYEHLERFWVCAHSNKPLPSPKALGTALRLAGFQKEQIAGKQTYYCKLEKITLAPVVARTGTEG